MLYDLNRGSVGQDLSNKNFDICIAGAGVAGITLSRKLEGLGYSVLLLEGGGAEFSSESQDLYAGKIIGREYFDLDASRLRYFGGTSGHWAGWCRHLESSDFEVKDHIPYSGWPIRKADLDPYQDETYGILDLPHRIKNDTIFPHSDGTLNQFEMANSPPTRFNEKYFEVIRRSKNIHLILNANLVDIRLDDTQSRVTSFICRSHSDVEAEKLFAAKKFVLALGGIENPRVLLNASTQMSNGVGNQKDVVGRYFAEHPHFQLGIYWKRTRPKTRTFLSPSAKLMNKEKIANCGLRLNRYGPRIADGLDAESAENMLRNTICDIEVARKFFASLGSNFGRCSYENFGRLTAAWEQTPNPESRVLLSDKRDKFGLRKVELDWRWTPMERRTPKVCAMEIGKALARGDEGRLKIADWVLDEAIPVPGEEDGEEVAGCHHMGTTRMSDSPETGVVDKNCCVFGLGNLYIAGSSVFTTFGHANPTFTIVQLALRLAHHIDKSNS